MSVRSLYRRFLPRRIRRHFWVARSFTAALCSHRRQETTRDVCAAFRLMLGRYLAVVRFDDGRRMIVDLRDGGLGRPLYRQRTFERAETAFISQFLHEGMTFLDVGANIGYHTLLASIRVGGTGCVIAYEPDPWNYELLTRNMTLNGIDNIHASRMALGRAPGEGALAKSHSNFGDHRLGVHILGRESVTVPVDTLDSQLKAPSFPLIDLMKIDVQGYEAEVFAGMASTLKAAPPKVILMEFWPYGIRQVGGDPDAIIATLMSSGYAPALLQADGTLVLISLAELYARIPQINPAEPDGAFVNVVWQR